MFYEPKSHAEDKANTGLPHDPWKSCLVPRPIGWITTVSTDGVLNLAPFSFFNGVCDRPPMVMFAPSTRADRIDPSTGVPVSEQGRKDTWANVEETGEFVVNMATWDQKDAMNISSGLLPPEVDEAALAGLEMLPSRLVKPPRVKGAPVHLECRHWKTVELPYRDEAMRYAVIIGEAIGIHIEDWALTDGLIDIKRLKPIARLGYRDYAVVTDTFTMNRPDQEKQDRQLKASPGEAAE